MEGDLEVGQFSFHEPLLTHPESSRIGIIKNKKNKNKKTMIMLIYLQGFSLLPPRRIL